MIITTADDQNQIGDMCGDHLLPSLLDHISDNMFSWNHMQKEVQQCDTVHLAVWQPLFSTVLILKQIFFVSVTITKTIAAQPPQEKLHRPSTAGMTSIYEDPDVSAVKMDSN